jgi:hypothetical protein
MVGPTILLLLRLIVATGTRLSSRCLATIREDTHPDTQTDGRDFLIRPLRWTHVSWYAYQVWWSRLETRAGQPDEVRGGRGKPPSDSAYSPLSVSSSGSDIFCVECRWNFPILGMGWVWERNNALRILVRRLLKHALWRPARTWKDKFKTDIREGVWW